MSTLQSAVDLFLGEQIESTRKSYYYNLRDMTTFCGPGRPLDQVTSEDLLKFGQFYRNKPEVRSPATYNKLVKTVRTFFNWCIKSKVGGITESPAAGLKRQRFDEAIDREKDMPESAYLQLIDFAKWDRRALALVLFLGDTGCRIGGAAGLEWGHIEFVKGSASVIEKGTPKRPVYFGEGCSHALLRWQEFQMRTRKGDFVFSGDGHRMTNDSLGQYFSRLCTRAGIGTYGPHSLRHRKGHQLADSRIAPTTAAMLLGHSDPTITLKHYYPKDWDRVQSAALQLSSDYAEKPIVIPRKARDNKRTG